MVLMAPAFGFARRWIEAIGPEQAGRWRATNRMEVHHYAEGRPRAIGYGLIEDGLRYEEYPEITQPALVYHGTGDAVVPAECSREFARRRSGVRLELVDSDHELMSAVETIWAGASEFFQAPLAYSLRDRIV